MTSQRELLYPDVTTLARINKRVVSLTGEKHEYTKEDERHLKELLEQVQKAANGIERSEAVIQKASILIFGIAKGQYFHEGNKRTALVAARSFLRMNGYEMNLSDQALEKAVDRAGVGQASLIEFNQIIKRLIRNV